MVNPNQAFKSRHSKAKAVKRPYSVLLIRCEATNCHHKTLIERSRWLDVDDEIECSNCGSISDWEAI